MLFGALRTVFCVLVLALALPAQADDSVYTVQGVTVDITAASATAARDQAFGQAKIAAFTQLAERLLPEDQFAAFLAPEESLVSAMVKDFEITDERLSHVRYVGTYTFRFAGAAVRGYFGSHNISYSDVASKPVLVLPYYQRGAQAVLWGENNPWLTAWGASKDGRGLVPVVVPIGDLQDVSDINDNQALTYDPQKLLAMTQRYDAGEAIVLLAVPEWTGGPAPAPGLAPDKLSVMVYRTDRGSPEFANKIEVTPAAGAEGDVFTAAVAQARETLQKSWKAQTAASAEQSNRLKARVRFAAMPEWIETQQALQRLQGVEEVRLLALTQGEASLEMIFQGTEDRLRLALAQADITLTDPAIDFSAPADGAAASPMIYDLYLNKYKQF